jgi:tRNA-dihydrouridine synthase
MSFWNTLEKPFFVLAPMADVTDPAFRRIISKYSRHSEEGGGPHVFWTEFVSADGLVSGGREILKRDLAYTEEERPIVAQLFSSNPKNMEEACRMCAEMGFDGIDINMGCPDKSIEKQGAGASMMKTPDIAISVIQAAKRGAPGLPISVKTRVGYNKVEIDTWIPLLLTQDLAALTIHARTRKDMSKVPANWEYVQEVVKLRDAIAPQTLIIGNGDVADIQDGYKKIQESGCDGAMIGRALFGNPWIFDQNKKTKRTPTKIPKLLMKLIPTTWMKKLRGDDRYTLLDIHPKERLLVLREHIILFDELLGDIKSYSIMKKHFKAYIHGWRGSKEMRALLMDTTSKDEAITVIDKLLKEF